MQSIKVRKPYDAVLYDCELDMTNLKSKNIYIYREVKRFFEFYRGNWDLEIVESLIVASTYKNRKNKKREILRSLLHDK